MRLPIVRAPRTTILLAVLVTAVTSFAAIAAPLTSAAGSTPVPATSRPGAQPAGDLQLQGEPGPYRIRNRYYKDRCLDSNYQGQVYLTVCERGNRYQKWIIWNGGFTKNLQTGRCLDRYATDARTIYCDANDWSQYWRHWSGGWFQQLTGSDYVLTADHNYPGNVFTQAPCSNCQRQFWSVYIDVN